MDCGGRGVKGKGLNGGEEGLVVERRLWNPLSSPARAAVQGVSATLGAPSQAPGEGGQEKWSLGIAKQIAP